MSFFRRGAARVLALSGDLDAHTAPEFEAALTACLAEGDVRIVADGSDLTYVSSAGLGVFMAVLEPAREAGGDIVIAALPARVFETFDLLGFPEVFRFAATVDEAAALFGEARRSRRRATPGRPTPRPARHRPARPGPRDLGTLRLAGHTAELARLRRAVTAWADVCGLAEAAARRLVQATDEAAANAIEHGMTDRAHGRIVVTARLDGDGLTVSVRYRGPRFDPTAAPAAAPAEALRARSVHGYGLLLIRRLVAQVGYAYRRGVNEVRLTARRGSG